MLGQRIKEMRKALRFSRRGLALVVADVTGLQEAAIARIERGRYLPNAGQLAHLLDALNASPEAREACLRDAREMALRRPKHEREAT